ncbi:MAG: DUF6807 family protein [Planctomycetales bacterium]
MPVLHALKLAVAVVLVLAAVLAPVAADEFRWQVDEERGEADLSFGAQPVVRYMFAYDTSTPARRAETFKPYHHVFGPGTGALITKGIGGLYTHHRGLFVGWNDIRFDGNRVDTWHGRAASQRHVRFVERKADANSGTMTAEIHWLDSQGEPFLAETRTLTASKILNPPWTSISPRIAGPGYAWRIDWSTKLESRRGQITLGGDRQHAGFQFRAAQAVAEANAARYIRPAGFPQQPEAFQVGDAGNPPKHIDLGWLAMTYELEGKRYTVEYFEAPGMPKPSLYSERPYGRFGAFFKAELDEDRPLEMRYRLIVSSGAAPLQEEVAKRYSRFASETAE